MTRDYAEPNFPLLDEPSRLRSHQRSSKKLFAPLRISKSQGGTKSRLQKSGTAGLNAHDFGCALKNSMIAEYRWARELRTCPLVTVAFLETR
ncbi:hypothetical protein [Paraburkholderia sp. RL17-337-BIB-A]|uniref:hypothetical protein n=1 Tax=Paraburkholderia sp. RL17-337-BIB-A TaxID=3031636 RepID=UPI0038BCED69